MSLMSADAYAKWRIGPAAGGRPLSSFTEHKQRFHKVFVYNPSFHYFL
jgi:hypothetical protein